MVQHFRTDIHAVRLVLNRIPGSIKYSLHTTNLIRRSAIHTLQSKYSCALQVVLAAIF